MAWATSTPFYEFLRPDCTGLLSPTAFMIACGAEWNDDDATLDAQEQRRDDDLLVQTMLMRGATVNVKDMDGKTPLMWAVAFDRSKSVDVLLEHEANVGTQDKNGWTALHHAASFTNEGIIFQRLLAHGANPSFADKDGATPLSLAQGRPDIVALFKQAGAKK